MIHTILVVLLIAIASFGQRFQESNWNLIEIQSVSPSTITVQPSTGNFWQAAVFDADIRTPEGVLVGQPLVTERESAINDALFDDDDRFWTAGTDKGSPNNVGGVGFYDLLTEEITDYDHLPLGRVAWQIERDGSTIYVGSNENIVAFSEDDPEDYEVFFQDHNTAFGMVMGKDGKLWALLGGSGSTLLGYIQDGEEYIVSNNDLPAGADTINIRSLTADQGGNIFISAGHDVITNKTGEWTFAYDGSEDDGLFIGKELTVDRDGNIWSIGATLDAQYLIKINGELEKYNVQEIPWITNPDNGTQLALDLEGRLIIAANKTVATYLNYKTNPVVRLHGKNISFDDQRPAKFFNLKGQIIRETPSKHSFSIQIGKSQ